MIFIIIQNYFNDEKIEAIHEMVRRGGYEFKKVELNDEKQDHYGTNNRDIAYVPMIPILGGYIMN